MGKQKWNTNKTALRGLLVAVAMVLSWVEAQIPAFFAVPGIKLGLTNLVVLVALYCLSEKDALAINVVRIVLVGCTFGNLFSLLYSMAGGVLSGVTMILLKKNNRFSIATVSVSGGIMHNVGQILVAMIVLETKSLLYYLPVLWLSGIAAGLVIGLVGKEVVKRLPRV
jgi:heptaprenyl diphosphate synthase